MGVPRMGQERQATDLETFSWFFAAEYPQVVRLLTVVLHDGAAAEDLAQEAFVRLHRHWTKVSGYESPEAWVRRVALNRAFSWRRRYFDRRLLDPSSLLHAIHLQIVFPRWNRLRRKFPHISISRRL